MESMSWQPPPPPYVDDPGMYGVGYATPRRSKWPFLLAGLVVLIGGLVTAFVLFMINLVGPAYDVANSYLAGLAAHDYIAAAAHTCDGSTEQAQRAGEFIEQAGPIGGFNLTSAELGTGTGEVSGSVSLGGQDFGISFDVGHGPDGWKVCDFFVSGLGSP